MQPIDESIKKYIDRIYGKVIYGKYIKKKYYKIIIDNDIEFQDFLVENNALKMFYKYIEKYNYRDLHFRNHYIIYMIAWRKTDEGYKYWLNLSEKWKNYLDEKVP